MRWRVKGALVNIISDSVDKTNQVMCAVLFNVVHTLPPSVQCCSHIATECSMLFTHCHQVLNAVHILPPRVL
jgi:hypothetical protein